jgi:hypothetical protein
MKKDTEVGYYLYLLGSYATSGRTRLSRKL